ARIADKFCLIRSVAHDSPQHVGAIHTTITGYPGELIETPPYKPKYPDLFTVAHKLLPTRRPGLPQYIGLPQLRCTGGAFLGRSYAPFSVAADPNEPRFAIPNISLDGAARLRLAGRVGLLTAFDRMRADVDRSGLMEAMDGFQSQALDLLTGPSVR